MLEVRLIGKFDIRFNGEQIILSSRAAQSLFAFLILSAGTRHRREKLAGTFWPEAPDGKARAYLRHELWRIRKVFSEKTDLVFLLSDDITISFDENAEYWLDVDQLAKLSEQSSTEDLMQALRVYEGDLLPGFYEDWVTEEREHLYAVFDKRIGQLLKILENEQLWQEIPDWAEYWLTFFPAQETAYQYLIRTYQKLGDKAKASEVYERCVQALRALDLEPSETTRAQVFIRNARLNLPIPLTSFIGRQNELKDVADLLKKSRLVTLTGSGGVGKTRLAIQVVAEVMESFPDGIWFLDLSSLNDPSYLADTVANLVGLLESGNPIPSVLDRLIEYFHTRNALLIFDNCEQLIEACALLVNSLLTSCDGLFVLATSREALRVQGEIPYRVPSLELPLKGAEERFETLANYSSVRLFAERAAVILPGFTTNPENILTIVRVCQRLDGIPLAIELAAARTDVLTVEQISARLDDSIRLLTHGLRSAPLRHETLRATIEWSVQLLSDKERLLFRRLAVFSGGWTLEAAEAVCTGNGIVSDEILDVLTLLINKSLIIVEQPVGGRNPAIRTNRYRSLETIRQYAHEKLLEEADAESLQVKHLQYFLRMVERVEPYLVGAQQSEWMDYLESELDNIRCALEWSINNRKAEQALRLFGALGWFWIVHCHFMEGLQWFNRGMELKQDVASSVLAKALGYAGSLLWIRDSLPESKSAMRKSIELYRVLGDKHELSNKLMALGVTELSDGNLQEARSLFEQTLTISREIDNRPATTRALFNLADIAYREGNPLAAAPLYEESLAICRQLHDDHLTTIALLNVADFAFGQKEYSKARDYYQEILDLSLDLKNMRVTALSLLGFADILCAVSMYSQSANLQGFSLKVLSELGVRLLEKDLFTYQETISLLTGIMGEETYNLELEAGRALQLEQAIEITARLKL